MEGKNTGAVMATIFFIIICAIIGSCFMAFVYKDKKITVADVGIKTTEGITVSNKNGESVETVKLSSANLGLKPVTGKEDKTTNIPSTVTSTNGSEGVYGQFCVTATAKWSVYITDVVINSGAEVESERENIFVALEEVEGSATEISGDKVLLASGDASSEPQKFTILVWLHSHAGQPLVGANISFNLTFELS